MGIAVQQRQQHREINPRTGEITHIAPDELTGERTPNFILSAQDGHIWIGFPGGVMRVQPDNNSIRMLPFDEYNHYAILSMAEADGKI